MVSHLRPVLRLQREVGFSMATKPKKLWADYPLYAHNAGVWAKKIRGKTHYFGPWSDPQGALETYLEQRDFLLAGKRPPATPTQANGAGPMQIQNVT